MSVFFTDSDCEIWYTDVDKYGINVIGMPYTLDGEEKFYDMGRNTDLKHMFNRMREDSVPATSALNPQNYIDYFEPVFKKGEDILYVHFSDKLSGTFNHLQTALLELKEKYPERQVRLFNTKSICFGAGVQVLEAAKMHKAGVSDEEIISHLEEFSPHVVMEFVVESLAHLKRGGRISAASAAMGGLLNIKPVIKITNEGKLEKFQTARGMKKALSVIVDRCVANIIKEQDCPIYILDADNVSGSNFVETSLREKLGQDVVIERYTIGPVIGAHCGPGTIGLVYYGNQR